MNGGDCTKEEREELMTYSDICNHVHREQSRMEDGEIYWKFRRILAHEGPLTHRDKNYKGCGYNLLVEWETGEQTMEPLNLVIADGPVTVACYARENNMLDTEGWRRLKENSQKREDTNQISKPGQTPFLPNCTQIPMRISSSKELQGGCSLGQAEW